MRWQEEVVLLQEEMRRTLAFLQWHADWWRERGGILEHVDEISKEGLEAYRQRQASLRLSLRDRFKANWKDVDLFVQMGKYAIEMGEDDDVDVSNTIVQSSD